MKTKASFFYGIIGIIIGILTGITGTGIVLWTNAQNMMIMEDQSKYDFETSVVKFTESVEAHGWKMPAVHDLQATMTKFGKNVKSVKVFELCHPDHAYKILSKDGERIVSSLMPCRVAIYEKNGKVFVSRMNSALMAKMMEGVIPEVMKEASYENEIILKSILAE